MFTVSTLLAKANVLQSAIAHSAFFSCIATDERGVIQIFNVGAERMLGYAAKDVIDLMTPAQMSDPIELLIRAKWLSNEFNVAIKPGFEALVFKAARGIEDIYELTYVCKDGARLPALVSVTSLRDTADEIIGYLLIGTDNTARKSSDNARRASETARRSAEEERNALAERLAAQRFFTLQEHAELLEREIQSRVGDLLRFRTAIDATADAIFITSRETMLFIEMNTTASQMFGYSRDEFLTIGPDSLRLPTAEHIGHVLDEIIDADESVGVLSEMVLRRKDGSSLDVEVHRKALKSGDEWVIVSVVRDIAERKKSERTRQRLSQFDTLTALPNRAFFNDNLVRMLATGNKQGWHLVLLCIDIDNFKRVNEDLGQSKADSLLVLIGERLLTNVRLRDLLGRQGGDEFSILASIADGGRDAGTIAAKISAAFHEPFVVDGESVSLSASIGVALAPQDSEDAETLMSYGVTAMRHAKQAGGNTFRFFKAEMNAQLVRRLQLEKALSIAVENHEFVLHYQPKVSLQTGTIVGLEALLRWDRPGFGLVSPGDFVPVLEETGIIVAVGAWVIAEAARQISVWLKSDIGPMHVAVNVSGRQFSEHNLDLEIAAVIEKYAIPSQLLEIELTESSLMDNTQRTLASLHVLKSQGVEISIDDFGTGFSSLAYLRRFPIDTLKIDIAFVRDISRTETGSIALSIIQLAHSLKLKVVAEGVETREQLDYLQRNCCDEVQGYIFSKPLPIDLLEDLLRSGRKLELDRGESSDLSQI